jgi:hypothetical protein
VRGAALLRAPQFDAILPVGIGQTANLVLHAVKPNDLCVSIFSAGLGPVLPLPPWGNVEIDPSSIVIYGVGIADASATFAHTLAIPATPSVIGSYAFQGWCGDGYRLFLSNAVSLTVQ